MNLYDFRQLWAQIVPKCVLDLKIITNLGFWFTLNTQKDKNVVFLSWIGIDFKN